LANVTLNGDVDLGDEVCAILLRLDRPRVGRAGELLYPFAEAARDDRRMVQINSGERTATVCLRASRSDDPLEQRKTIRRDGIGADVVRPTHSLFVINRPERHGASER